MGFLFNRDDKFIGGNEFTQAERESIVMSGARPINRSSVPAKGLSFFGVKQRYHEGDRSFVDLTKTRQTGISPEEAKILKEVRKSRSIIGRTKRIGKQTFKSLKPTRVQREQVAESVAGFAGVQSLGQSFTPEQEALQQMFGGGEKIWGTIGEPVTINNDLNPSRRGDRGTADIFGFGGDGERSGLF